MKVWSFLFTAPNSFRLAAARIAAANKDEAYTVLADTFKLPREFIGADCSVICKFMGEVERSSPGPVTLKPWV